MQLNCHDCNRFASWTAKRQWEVTLTEKSHVVRADLSFFIEGHALCLFVQIGKELSMQRKFASLQRAGAAGKALLVWLFSGSIGLALIAYLVFHGMGC